MYNLPSQLFTFFTLRESLRLLFLFNKPLSLFIAGKCAITFNPKYKQKMTTYPNAQHGMYLFFFFYCLDPIKMFVRVL